MMHVVYLQSGALDLNMMPKKKKCVQLTSISIGMFIKSWRER
jgi:hypothetical protein